MTDDEIVRDYQEFRARGRFSSLADEPFAEDDGELGLGLEPFARRSFPFTAMRRASSRVSRFGRRAVRRSDMSGIRREAEARGLRLKRH